VPAFRRERRALRRINDARKTDPLSSGGRPRRTPLGFTSLGQTERRCYRPLNHGSGESVGTVETPAACVCTETHKTLRPKHRPVATATRTCTVRRKNRRTDTCSGALAAAAAPTVPAVQLTCPEF
jgi:hypothetical protein